MAILLLYGNVVRHPLRYIEVKDMSEKRVEDTNQKCADVLVWVSFLLLHSDRCLEKGVEDGVQFLHLPGSE